jgi:hypothetical protein
MTSFINNINTTSDITTNKYCFNESNLFVFENFLDDKDYNTLEQLLITLLRNDQNNNLSYIKFGHSSVGWHPNFIPHWSYDLTKEDFFCNFMLSKIRGLYDWTANLSVKRIYTSFQTAAQHGNWHIDDETDRDFTFTIYCNIHSSSTTVKTYVYDTLPVNTNINYDDTDGYFTIKYKNNPITFVRTQNNTAVLLTANVMHNGSSPRFDSTLTRCVVAFKLHLPYNNNEQNNDIKS